MSYSTIYTVYLTKAVAALEFRNSWGSMPPMCEYLGSRYLGWRGVPWLLQPSSEMQKMWDLSHNDTVPEKIRLVFAFMFDNAYCPWDKIPLLADACQYTYEVLSAYSVGQGKGDVVNHWAEIGRQIRKLKKSSSKCIGISIGATSVSDTWSEWKGKKGPFDISEIVDPKWREEQRRENEARQDDLSNRND